MPTLYLDIVFLESAEGIDESLGEADIGHQWNIVVDGAAANLVAVGKLALRLVLGHIDNEVESVLGDEVEHIVVAVFIWP